MNRIDNLKNAIVPMMVDRIPELNRLLSIHGPVKEIRDEMNTITSTLNHLHGATLNADVIEAAEWWHAYGMEATQYSLYREECRLEGVTPEPFVL